MAHRHGSLPHRRKRLLRALRGQAEAAVVGQGAALREGGQRRVGPAQRLAQGEHGGHDHVARARYAGDQPGVGIQPLLGLADEPQQALARHGAQIGQRKGVRGRSVELAAQCPQLSQPPVGLRLKEEGGVGNGLGLGRAQLVDQFRVHFARPGPAADVGNALVVDRDDRHALAGLAMAGRAGEIVETALQAIEQVGRNMQGEHGEHHPEAQEGIGSPDPASAWQGFCLAGGHVAHSPGGFACRSPRTAQRSETSAPSVPATTPASKMLHFVAAGFGGASAFVDSAPHYCCRHKKRQRKRCPFHTHAEWLRVGP